MTREELNAVRGYVSNIQALKDAHNTEQLPINYGTICTITANGWKLIEELKALEQQPCEDCISRQDVLDALHTCLSTNSYDDDVTGDSYICYEEAEYEIEKLQSVQLKPEIKPIGYRECSDAMLKMWMDNVLTDGEYYRIMDKLNAKWGKINEVES